VLRRSGVTSETSNSIELRDGTRIDVRNLSGERGDEPMVFTRREMDILEYLAKNTERPVSRDELLNKVWGYARGLDLETRTVDIHIAKLRRKIEAGSGDPQHLVTVRGAGYRLLVT
jgi:two-component system response regulator RegX3